MQSTNDIITKLVKFQVKDAKIDNISLNSKNELIINISKKVVKSVCPCCNHKTKRIHDHRIQKIKHCPISGYKTFFYLKKTRLLCTNCGKKFYMDYNNIVNPRFRCSNELFNSIIGSFQFFSTSIKDVAKFNFVSTGVVRRYLKIFNYFMQWNKTDTLPKHIGIDEFKGNCNGSKYLFHIYDLDTKNTVHILQSRNYADIVKFFDSIENRNDVELVTMDLYEPFRNAVKAKFKKATIVADRFHYTRIISNALDSYRLQLWHNTKGNEKKYLKGIKKTLLKDIEKVKKDKLLKHEERLNHAFEISGELKYAYQLYQSFLRIKECESYQEKVKRFRDWIEDALSSTLKPFESAANTLLRWNKEILNSFNTNYSNSSTEGKNNKIKVQKRIGYGYRDLEIFFTLIKLRDCKN